MQRLLAADVDVVRFNVKHQTPAENQMLLDMWRAAADQDWQGQQQRLGLGGLVHTAASPVGIMVSVWLLSEVLHLALMFSDRLIAVNGFCAAAGSAGAAGAGGAGARSSEPCGHHGEDCSAEKFRIVH
jgi:hypothetical protein